MKTKRLAIMGPTAGGKSSLAVALAEAYGGEIISADSRQVYRGMDIGTGKVPRDQRSTPDFQLSTHNPLTREPVNASIPYFSNGIPHYLLDVADPNDEYNVTDFQRDAGAVMTDIERRGKLPVLCGGTGFWIQALVEAQRFPDIPPNRALREELGTLDTETLFARLESIDPRRAATVDRNNPLRLIRAIEVASALGSVPPLESHPEKRKEWTLVALSPDQETLHRNIERRLDERLTQGLVEEVSGLRERGLGWERLENFGLEYYWVARYLKNDLPLDEMRTALLQDIKAYAKRQLTYLRRWERQGAEIRWTASPEEALGLISGHRND